MHRAGGGVSDERLHFVMRNTRLADLVPVRPNGKHPQKPNRPVAKPVELRRTSVVAMSDCLISSYQTGGSSGGEVPMDQISLNYSKIEIITSLRREGYHQVAAALGHEDQHRWVEDSKVSFIPEPCGFSLGQGEAHGITQLRSCNVRGRCALC